MPFLRFDVPKTRPPRNTSSNPWASPVFSGSEDGALLKEAYLAGAKAVIKIGGGGAMLYSVPDPSEIPCFLSKNCLVLAFFGCAADFGIMLASTFELY